MGLLTLLLLWAGSIGIYWKLVRRVGNRHWLFFIYSVIFLTPTIAYYKILGSGPFAVYPLWVGLPMYLEPSHVDLIVTGIIPTAIITGVVAMAIRAIGRL